MTRIDKEHHRGVQGNASSSPRSRGRIRFLHDRSVRTRVAALVLLPLVATTLLGAIVVQDSLEEAAETVPAEHLTNVGVAAADVARQLHNERFATEQAVQADSDANLARVAATRQATDQAIADYFDVREPLDPRYFGYDIENTVDTFEWDLDGLDQMRADHDAQVEGTDISTYYSTLADQAEEISAGATDIIVRQRELGPTLAKAVDGAKDAADQARLIAIISVAVVVVVLAITIVMTIIVARSIIGPLRRLRAAALDTAKSSLPALVDRIQRDGPAVTRRTGPAAKVEGEDEIGQVASAFNDVHATAVRIAGEQALLRQNLDTIVVNLSRRTQSLVDRQLGELETLESRERDPDQLSTLFRIDHMATRVRRHADSLLILAGVDEMRRHVPASPVLDVVRGAVGEVEQYSRVEFGVMPADLVVASAVHDTAHLLAELIDNATEFSAPSTPVTVTSQPLLGGGLRIQVTDTGLGIPPDQLTELNNRLESPGDIDVAASRTLGLYVVARLANKHGIKVHLEPATPGTTGASGTTTPGASGTVAQIDLPSTLILSPLDTTDDVISAIQSVDEPPSTPPARQPQQTQPPTQPRRPAQPIAREPDYTSPGRQSSLPRRELAAPGQPSQEAAPAAGRSDGNRRPAQPAQSLWDSGTFKQVTSTPAEGGRTAERPNPPRPVAPLTSRDQVQRISSLSVPQPQFPKSDTPVYDAVRSAWFSKGKMPQDFTSPADAGWRRAAEARMAAEAAAAAANNAMASNGRPPAATTASMRSNQPRTAEPNRAQQYPQRERQAASAASLWPSNGQTQSPSADPASAPTTAPKQSQGLPTRQKGASLLPGSISAVTQQQPQQDAPTSQPPTDSRRVASTLSSLQRGVSRGREETGGWVPKRPGGPERSSS